MADLVTLKAKTTFYNSTIRLGDAVGGTVSDGDTFETDPNHAKDLVRLGHAEPVSGTIHDLPDAPLQPGFQVSEPALRADRARRQAAEAKPVEADAVVEGDAAEQRAGRGQR